MSVTRIKNYTQFVNENLGGGLKDFKGKKIFEAEEGEVEKLDFKKAFLGGGVAETEYAKYLDDGEFSFISNSVFLDEGFFKLLDRSFNKNAKFKQQFFRYIKTDSDVKYFCDSILLTDNTRAKPSDLVFTPQGLKFKTPQKKIAIKPVSNNSPVAVLFAPMELETVSFSGTVNNPEWGSSFDNCKIKNLYVSAFSMSPTIGYGNDFPKFVQKAGIENLFFGRTVSVDGLFTSKNQQPSFSVKSVKIENVTSFLELSSKSGKDVYSIFKTDNLEIEGDGRISGGLGSIGKNKVYVSSSKTNLKLEDVSYNGQEDELNLAFLNCTGGVNIENGIKNVFIAGLPISKTNSVAVDGSVKLTDEAKKQIGAENITPGKKGEVEADNNSLRYNNKYTLLNEAKSCKPKVTKFLKEKECEGINYITGTCKVGTKTMKIEKALIKLEAPESLIKSYSEECSKEVNEALRLMRRR